MNSEWDSMDPHRQSNSRPSRAEWTEDMAKHGLAFLSYPGKWNSAVQSCKSPVFFEGDYAGYSYWERVHIMFLELGGCRVEQLLPYQQRAYNVAPTTGVLSTESGIVIGEVTASIVLEDPRQFGGSDELKAHLHAFWGAELAHDLRQAGLS